MSTTTPDGGDPGRPAEMKNISRVDSGATHGWSVRFQRRGRATARFFTDARHGGPDEALAAAQAWRDEQRERLGPARQDPSRMHTRKARQRNREAVSRTGVTGIGFVAREFTAQTVPYVTAYWIDEGGRRRQTSFSIGHHGVEGAVRLAAKARARTADWHGGRRMSAKKIYEAAVDRIRELAEPYQP